MSLPYIPLYIDDYEADTAHLTLLEDGAYNRLLRLLWRSPGCSIPDDDAWIFRRMRAHSEAEQEAIRSVISEFFERKNGRVISPRLSREFKKADQTSAKRSEAGKRGGRPKAIEKANKDEKPGFDFDKAGPKHPEPEPEPEPDISGGGGGSACAREAGPPPEIPDDLPRVQILAAMGIGPDGIAGPSRFLGTQADVAEAQRWLGLPGITLPVVVEEIRRICAGKAGGPPARFSYFTPAMQRLSAVLTAPPLDQAAGQQARASPPQAAFPRIRAQLPTEAKQ